MSYAKRERTGKAERRTKERIILIHTYTHTPNHAHTHTYAHIECMRLTHWNTHAATHSNATAGTIATGPAASAWKSKTMKEEK